MMLATDGGAAAADARRQETDFVQTQVEAHRQRGDDPHLRRARTMIRYHVHAVDGGIGHVDGMIVVQGLAGGTAQRLRFELQPLEGNGLTAIHAEA